MNFESAIKRPFQDLKTFVIGIIVSLIPIVNFCAFGFALECGRRSSKGDNSLPKWENWGALFLNGLKLLVVVLVYQIPTLVVAVLTLGATATTIISGLAAGNLSALTGSLGSLSVGLLITVLFSLVFGLLGIGGALRMANSGSFGSAFNFGEARRVGLNGQMFFAYILVVVVGLVLSLLNVIPIAGTGAALFISLVFGWTLYGEAYRAVSGAPVAKPVAAKRKGKRK